MVSGMQKYFYKIRLSDLTVLFIFLFYSVSRLILIFRHGQSAFGYDTGIYRFIIQGHIDRLGDPTLVPFAFSAFSNVLSLLGDNLDKIMYVWYFGLSIFIIVALCLVVRTYFNKSTAMTTLVLFAFSITQFEFYQWYYYRNFIALFLVLICLLLIHHQSYLLILPLVVLGSIHPISLLPFGLAIIIYLFFDQEKRKFLFISGLTTLLAILILNWPELKTYLLFFVDNKGWAGNLTFGQANEFSGQFISFGDYWRVALLYLPFAIIGIFKYWRKQKFLTIFVLVNIILILFKLMFYRRFYIFIDLILIMFAARVLVDYAKMIKKERLGKLVIGLFVFFLVLNFGRYFFNIEPLISQAELAAIEDLQSLPKDNFIMTISPYYAPWLYGFTDHKIIAPGMFENNLWNKIQWEQFWNTEDQTIRHQLLDQYNSYPIYIYLGEKDAYFIDKIVDDSRFIQLNQTIWEYGL